MNEMQLAKVKKLAEDMGADGYKFVLNWNGYEVYDLEFDEFVCIGTPMFILVNDKEVRLTEQKEGFEILHLLPDDEG